VLFGKVPFHLQFELIRTQDIDPACHDTEQFIDVEKHIVNEDNHSELQIDLFYSQSAWFEYRKYLILTAYSAGAGGYKLNNQIRRLSYAGLL